MILSACMGRTHCSGDSWTGMANRFKLRPGCYDRIRQNNSRFLIQFFDPILLLIQFLKYRLSVSSVDSTLNVTFAARLDIHGNRYQTPHWTKKLLISRDWTHYASDVPYQLWRSLLCRWCEPLHVYLVTTLLTNGIHVWISTRRHETIREIACLVSKIFPNRRNHLCIVSWR